MVPFTVEPAGIAMRPEASSTSDTTVALNPLPGFAVLDVIITFVAIVNRLPALSVRMAGTAGAVAVGAVAALAAGAAGLQAARAAMLTPASRRVTVRVFMVRLHEKESRWPRGWFKGATAPRPTSRAGRMRTAFARRPD